MPLPHILLATLNLPLDARFFLVAAGWFLVSVSVFRWLLPRAQGLAGRATADGYRLMLELADEQLALGISVILEAVFPLAGFRVSAQELAQRHSARFRAIYCYCSDEGVWQKRMQLRQPLVPHWTPVGWDDVERLRASFQPWDPEEALFIDSVNELEENLALVLKWVQ